MKQNEKYFRQYSIRLSDFRLRLGQLSIKYIYEKLDDKNQFLESVISE